ncbi:MAG: hypothetical protein QOD25_1309, partial [Alphaproteobacteria bacterium]|nr:hypothetical protein [Alphaproteobacteria bacterium]
ESVEKLEWAILDGEVMLTPTVES